MMIRLRGGGRGAGAGNTSRVEICNAVVDRARVRTAWIRSAPVMPEPAAASTGAGAPRRPIPYRAPRAHPTARTARTASPGAAAWE